MALLPEPATMTDEPKAELSIVILLVPLPTVIFAVLVIDGEVTLIVLFPLPSVMANWASVIGLAGLVGKAVEAPTVTKSLAFPAVEMDVVPNVPPSSEILSIPEPPLMVEAPVIVFLRVNVLALTPAKAPVILSCPV